MKFTNRIVLILAIQAMLIFVLAKPTASCSCAGPSQDPVEELGKADFVLTGKVIASQFTGPRFLIMAGDTMWYPKGGNTVRWRFVITSVWKGALEDTVEIYSPRFKSACGIEFEIGESYLVYGYMINAEPTRNPYRGRGPWPQDVTFPIRMAGSCSRTRPLV
jgi:hypothetical protein